MHLTEQQHAFFAILSELMQVEEIAVGRRGIDFEVSRVNHDTQRCMYRQRNAINQAVGNP